MKAKLTVDGYKSQEVELTPADRDVLGKHSRYVIRTHNTIGP